MKTVVEKTNINYTGVDVVESIIEDNKKKLPDSKFDIFFQIVCFKDSFYILFLFIQEY